MRLDNCLLVSFLWLTYKFQVIIQQPAAQQQTASQPTIIQTQDGQIIYQQNSGTTTTTATPAPQQQQTIQVQTPQGGIYFECWKLIQAN